VSFATVLFLVVVVAIPKADAKLQVENIVFLSPHSIRFFMRDSAELASIIQSKTHAHCNVYIQTIDEYADADVEKNYSDTVGCSEKKQAPHIVKEDGRNGQADQDPCGNKDVRVQFLKIMDKLLVVNDELCETLQVEAERRSLEEQVDISHMVHEWVQCQKVHCKAQHVVSYAHLGSPVDDAHYCSPQEKSSRQAEVELTVTTVTVYWVTQNSPIWGHQMLQPPTNSNHVKNTAHKFA